MRSHTLVAGDRVQADGRLVEHQQPRGADQRLGEFQPAHHAARVGLGQPVGGLRQVDRGQRLAAPARPVRGARRRRPGRTARRSPGRSARRRRTAAGHVAEQRRTGIGAGPGRGRRPGPCRAAPGSRVVMAADRGGLAGAVRAEQSEDLAGVDRQVEVVDGLGLAEGVLQAACRRRPRASTAGPAVPWRHRYGRARLVMSSSTSGRAGRAASRRRAGSAAAQRRLVVRRRAVPPARRTRASRLADQAPAARRPPGWAAAAPPGGRAGSVSRRQQAVLDQVVDQGGDRIVGQAQLLGGGRDPDPGPRLDQGSSSICAPRSRGPVRSRRNRRRISRWIPASTSVSASESSVVTTR